MESDMLPTCIQRPRYGVPSEYCNDVWYGKTRMVWLPDGEQSLTIRLLGLTECVNMSDTHADRQTA